MTAWLRKAQHAVAGWLARGKIRREAARAFRYDRRQFMEWAGALHPEGRTAALAGIVMGYHVLEKGLTMPRRRTPFGRAAALELARRVSAFEGRWGADPQAGHAVAVLRAYRELHAAEAIPELDAFLAARPGVEAAVEPRVRKEEYFAMGNAEFPRFAASRHCVRHFAGAAGDGAIRRAVATAMSAPSACNRQPCHVHVVCDPDAKRRLLALQGGARGFGEDADRVLLVTSDFSCVRWAWERHDAWTNGGIFAMALCLALHHEEVAHCILHWSVPPEADREAHRLLGIPDNEAIVLAIACGSPPEVFDVAASPRRQAESVMVWHGH